MSSTPDTVQVKSLPFEVKAVGTEDDLAEGEFIGYASAFGNVDSYGDIVEPTFFDRTLGEWAEKGDTVPVLWGHDMMDPFSFVGGALSLEPDEKGLKVHGTLDVEDNPKAAQVYRLLKGRRVRKMSFAYSVTDSEQKEDGNHLKDGDLYEVSIVPVPANADAEILGVKAALAPLLVKAGRVLSAKNERSLREARDSIDAVLAALEAQDGEEDQDKASGKPLKAKATGQPEDRKSGKGPSGTEEPERGPSVDDWATMFTIAEGA